MKTTNITMAGPEFAVLKVAMAQIGLWFDFPIRMPSMLRDAKVLDAQAGFKTGIVQEQFGIKPWKKSLPCLNKSTHLYYHLNR